MKQQVRALGWRAAQRAAPTVSASVADIRRLQQRVREIGRLRQEVNRLRQRVAVLETEVQEMRRLNRRVAELTDIVEEVLVPATDRDDERLHAALERYQQML